MNEIPEFVYRHPKVFVVTNNEQLGIFSNASLEDLFNAYSDIVHYIDSELITVLENLIREKIQQLENNSGQ